MPMHDPQFEQWLDRFAYLHLSNTGTSIYESPHIDPHNLYDQNLTPEEAMTRCMDNMLHITHCFTCD